MELVKHLQNIKPSFLSNILDSGRTDDMISLAGGLPCESCFPLSILEQCFAKVMVNPSLFQYGSTVGYQPLIDYFQDAYKLPDTHQALICTGSQQAIDLTIRAFIEPGDKILLEAPSYVGTLQAFSLAQADILTVDQTPTGVDLEQLESLMANNRIKMFYAVPDFNNPTGLCWCLETRKAAAALCQKYDVLLVEDVPYRDLRFSGETLPLVSEFCKERAIITRSFSKISTPGIRLGVIYGPEQWIKALIHIKQAADLHTSMPMQAVMLHLITHEGFKEHSVKCLDLYRTRYTVLAKAIKEKLPPEFTFNSVDGGMFLWLNMPGIDVNEFAKSALEHGVSVIPSTAFYPSCQTEAAPPAVRLNYTYANEEDLVEGVNRMAQVLELMK